MADNALVGLPIEIPDDFLSRVPEAFHRDLCSCTINIIRKHQGIGRLAVEVGIELQTVKNNIAHGNFTTYINTYLPFSERTAQHYMSVADCFRDIVDDVAHLPLAVLIELARQNDQELLASVLKAYEAGRKLNDKDVAELARSMAKGGSSITAASPSLIIDQIISHVSDDRTSALLAFKFVASQDLLRLIKHLHSAELDVLCRRLQNSVNRRAALSKRQIDIDDEARL